jgi:hydrogenase nickel incorporation protein HypA/HybF
MHEAAITQSLLDLALEKAREAGAQKITRISLTVGNLAGVVPDSVQYYFDFISKKTLAEGAALNFSMQPVRLHCRACSRDFTPADHDWTCPDCHQISPEIVAGRECYMESIEVE